MKIVNTFVPNLYAFHLIDEDIDELRRVLLEWDDPLFLYDFFNKNKADLKGKYTINEAVCATEIESLKFINRMTFLANTKPHSLNEIFSNLYNNEYRASLISRQKAKQSCLRLYSLKIKQEDKEDIYIITGGMIKLTQSMEEREHGKRELAKINKCRDYLKSLGVYDSDTFYEIIF